MQACFSCVLLVSAEAGKLETKFTFSSLNYFTYYVSGMHTMCVDALWLCSQASLIFFLWKESGKLLCHLTRVLDIGLCDWYSDMRVR